MRQGRMAHAKLWPVCDFSLWVVLKERIFICKPADLDELQAAIEDEFEKTTTARISSTGEERACPPATAVHAASPGRNAFKCECFLYILYIVAYLEVNINQTKVAPKFAHLPFALCCTPYLKAQQRSIHNSIFHTDLLRRVRCVVVMVVVNAANRT